MYLLILLLGRPPFNRSPDEAAQSTAKAARLPANDMGIVRVITPIRVNNPNINNPNNDNPNNNPTNLISLNNLK